MRRRALINMGTRVAARRGTAIMMMVGFLCGCAATKSYVATAEDNVRISTMAESGSSFSSIRAAMDVHSVDADCRTTYQGTMELDRSPITTGIPAGQESLLVFVFSNSSFLGSSRSTIRYETLLSPRSGYGYEIDVQYVDGAYDAVLYEVDRGGRRETRSRLP